MPQMGESVAEGTIVRWIKKVGDAVERDEPLFEISTDKVDAEIPSPAAGVLSEIRAHEGDTVPVNSVVAVIGDVGSGRIEPAHGPSPDVPVHDGPSKDGPTTAGQPPASSLSEERLSPLVRRIAKEHNVDIAKVRGTGIGGRVTKEDILGFIAQERQEAPKAAPVAGRSEKLSVMRKKIAEHMVLSRHTSAHVHSVFEVDFSRVAAIRKASQLTFLPFILKTVADALRAMPIVNASLDGDTIVYHDDVNLGVAVALDWGLIVPVIRKAQDMDVAALGVAVTDLATRARAKQLKPDEVSGGTFTITNPGVFGAQFGLPIINQPQVAILCIGTIEKRPVVIDDAIVIRTMAYLTLGFDHRLIDGAVADQFLARIKHALENWN